jgi:integrase
MSDIQYLPTSELKKLFRAFYAAGNPVHHMAALALLYSAARVSQVLNMRGTDVYEFDGRMIMKVGAAKRGSDGRHDLHFEPDPAFDMTPLIDMAKRAGESFLFGSLSRQYFDQVLKRVGWVAGIHEDYLHAHMFRHSAAMNVMDKTQRIGAVTKLLQHKSPMSAMVYLAENDGRMAQDAMNALQLSAA